MSPPILSLRFAALLLLMACLTAGCRSLDASAWNLAQVHDGGGGFERRAAPMGHLEFNLRSAFDALGGGWVERSLGTAGKPERDVRRPAELAREEILRLFEYDGDDPRLRALQVEFGARLVVESPDPVARERAAWMLRNAAERLGVERVAQGPDGEPLAAEGVAELARELYTACEGGELSSDLQLGRVLDRIAAAAFDRDGAWRMLGALNVQLRQGGRVERARERYLEVHAELQRTATALGLGAALRDPRDRVQVPAVDAVWDMEPTQALDLYVQALERGLPRVLERIARRVADEGLPPEQATGEAYGIWMQALIRATDAPDGPAAVAASRALDAVSPVALGSLRNEDWTRWWRTEGAELVRGESSASAEPLDGPAAEAVDAAGVRP